MLYQLSYNTRTAQQVGGSNIQHNTTQGKGQTSTAVLWHKKLLLSTIEREIFAQCKISRSLKIKTTKISSEGSTSNFAKFCTRENIPLYSMCYDTFYGKEQLLHESPPPVKRIRCGIRAPAGASVRTGSVVGSKSPITDSWMLGRLPK